MEINKTILPTPEYSQLISTVDIDFKKREQDRGNLNALCINAQKKEIARVVIL